MKFIKKFNESINDEYYYSTDYEDFNKNTRVEEFSELDIDILTKLCKKNKIKLNLYDNTDKVISIVLYFSSHTNLNENKMIIYKEEDEWFIVSYKKSSSITYYKADQMDGLLKLIEDMSNPAGFELITKN